jgi:hypothetical protein
MDDLTSGKDDLVSLLVPRRYYLTIVQYLAELTEKGDVRMEADHISTGSELESFASKTSRQTIRALKTSSDLKGAARALFELAAARPGEWITFAEALERANVTRGEGQSDIREHWKGKGLPPGLSTPLETKTVAGGKKVYRLSPENAQEWNSAPASFRFNTTRTLAQQRGDLWQTMTRLEKRAQKLRDENDALEAEHQIAAQIERGTNSPERATYAANVERLEAATEQMNMYRVQEQEIDSAIKETADEEAL